MDAPRFPPGRIGTLAPGVPGMRTLTLPRFAVRTDGSYYVTLGMTGSGTRSVRGLPHARLTLRAGATRVSAVIITALALLAVAGLAMLQPSFRPVAEADPHAQLS